MDSLPVRLSSANLRPMAYRVLSKKHGLNIKTDALIKLTEAVSVKFGANWKGRETTEFLEEIARLWKLEDRGLFLDEEGITQVLRSMDGPQKSASPATQAMPDWKEYFRVINPPQQPVYEYDRVRKQFHTSEKPRHGEAAVSMFANRYQVVADRLSRNEMFQKRSFSSFSSVQDSSGHEITIIKNMLGRDGQTFYLFGLLSKNANDDWILEDSSDYIELNIDQTYKNVSTFYGPGMFVIAEGIYSASGGHNNGNPDYMGGCFYVSNMASPAAERREVSLENYGYLDFMGINQEQDSTQTRVPKEMIKRMVQVEKSLTGHKIIFLGCETHLDDKDVMLGLSKFFINLEAELTESWETGEASEDTSDRRAPLAIVMTGSFTKTPVVPSSVPSGTTTASEHYHHGFDLLAKMIEPLTQVRKCMMVLIPGKNDPWQSTFSQGSSAITIVPQKPVPTPFLARLQRTLPKLVIGWNPLRINYLSQEIVVVRDNYMSSFKLNDIIFANDIERMQNEAEFDDSIPKDRDERIAQMAKQSGSYISRTTEQSRRLVKTLLDQGNLQPFLPTRRLVNASYNHVLRIDPLPTLMVVQDASFDSFELLYMGCRVVNVGRLVPKHQTLRYGIYYPSSCKFVLNDVYF